MNIEIMVVKIKGEHVQGTMTKNRSINPNEGGAKKAPI